MSLSQRIREILATNIDMPTEEVLAKFGRGKAQVRPGLIYNIRGVMKKEQAAVATAEANGKPAKKAWDTIQRNEMDLMEYTKKAIQDCALSLQDIKAKVEIQGYVHNSSQKSLQRQVERKLCLLAKDGLAWRNGSGLWSLMEDVVPNKPVEQEVATPPTNSLVSMTAIEKVKMLMEEHGPGFLKEIKEVAALVDEIGVEKVCKLADMFS